MNDASSPALAIGGRFDEFVPIEVLERSRERFVVRTRFDAGHLNAAGMVHGGFIAAFLDIAIAGGGASALGQADRYGITLNQGARTATVIDLESMAPTATLMMDGVPRDGATSADGSTLFVNIQNPGWTIAITGPWKR